MEKKVLKAKRSLLLLLLAKAEDGRDARVRFSHWRARPFIAREKEDPTDRGKPAKALGSEWP